MRIIRAGGLPGVLLFLGLFMGCSRSEPAPEYEAINRDQIFALVVPVGMTDEQLLASTKAQCGQRDFCQVHGWASEAAKATGFPMTDAEAAARIFSYSVNRSTGFEQALYDCKARPQTDRDRCL